MKRTKILVLIIASIFLSLMVVGCTAGKPVNSDSSLSPNIQASQVPPRNGNSANGPSFELLNQGLENLKSYHVSFVQNVNGTLDGQPYSRKTSIELSHASGKIDFTREISGKDEPQAYLRVMTADQSVYYWYSADQACQGRGGGPQIGEIVDPASLLLPVTNSSEVGPETVNNVPAVHYTFDESGLNLNDPKQAVHGDFWISNPGGYIVKYRLKADAPTSLTGKNYEVERSWEYELSQADSIASVDLPEDCAAVPADIPTLPDAAGISLSNGLLSFTTVSSASAVTAFYIKELKPLGWTTSQDISSSIKTPFALVFTKDEQNLSLNLDETGQSTRDVTIIISTKSLQSEVAIDNAQTPVVTAQPVPEPTFNAAESGLPEDIPVYAGAAGLVKTDSYIQFNTNDDLAVVMDFYRREMDTLGWGKLTENLTGDSPVIVWQKSSRLVTISFTTGDGKTTIMVIPTNLDK